MRVEPTYLICVGATKAGTSWLFDHLSRHPECHLRSVKELHYFDRPEGGAEGWQVRANRAKIVQRAQKLAAGGKPWLARQIVDLEDWNAVLTEGSVTLDAYRAYVTKGLAAQKLVADITPSYATLPAPVLRRMNDIGADVRIVYLLRDPVDRLWSHVRMLAGRVVARPEDVPAAAVARMQAAVAGDDPLMDGRGDYRGGLQRLRAAFAPEKLLVMFTEELLTLPGMQRLWAFLGLSPAAVDFDQKVHASVPVALPSGLAAQARVALQGQYDYVASCFPTLPDAWSQNMMGNAA